MSSPGASDNGSILVMTGMNLGLPPGPGPTHRMTYLIRYLDERRMPYTAIFPHPGDVAREWKSGAGTFIGIPSAVLGEYLPRASRRQLQLNVLRLTRFAMNVLRMKRRHWRICIVHGDFMADLAVALRQMGKIDFLVYEDLDFLPAFDRSPHSFNRTQVEFTENLAIRNSDLVVSVSTELTMLRLEQGAKEAITVPNGVDLSVFARQDSKGGRNPYLLYCGALETWSGVHVTINAMPRILEKIPEVRFKVVGRGFCDPELRALARERGVEAAVDFLGPRIHDELPAIHGECSIGMAVFPANELMRYAFPLKVSEYLAAGLPVVSTGADGTKRILKESGAGLFIENNSEAVAQACIGLMTDRAKWSDMSRRAREAARKLDWKLLFDDEMKHIRDSAGGGE